MNVKHKNCEDERTDKPIPIFPPPPFDSPGTINRSTYCNNKPTRKWGKMAIEKNIRKETWKSKILKKVRVEYWGICERPKWVSSHFNLRNGLPGNVWKLYCQPEPRKQCGFSGAWAMLTHWDPDKISQTFLRAFSGMKMWEFHLRFHWNLFLRYQLTILQNWLR